MNTDINNTETKMQYILDEKGRCHYTIYEIERQIVSCPVKSKKKVTEKRNTKIVEKIPDYIYDAWLKVEVKMY